MQTPEERREYIRWYRQQYAEHIKYRRRYNTLLKRGIKDPDAYMEKERKEAQRKAELLELEKQYPWLRVNRLIQEQRAKQEKARLKRERAAQKAKTKASADYVAMLIELEEQREREKKE